jgi:diguanylate cyclase (GGDEF)-like protein
VGGEEFALVLPEATLDNACVAAERLRRLIAALTMTAGNNAVPVTVSIGATGATTDLSGIEELIKQADMALYEAKRSGRNQVCRFGMTQSSGVAAVGG